MYLTLIEIFLGIKINSTFFAVFDRVKAVIQNDRAARGGVVDDLLCQAADVRHLAEDRARAGRTVSDYSSAVRLAEPHASTSFSSQWLGVYNVSIMAFRVKPVNCYIAGARNSAEPLPSSTVEKPALFCKAEKGLTSAPLLYII